jgi:predicted dehydrogenase
MSHEPVKVGLIGAGNISRNHMRAFKQFPERLRLQAVCDPNEESAHARASEFDNCSVYKDASRMIKDADIDAVDICTTHDTHAELAIASSQAGKHVLVEKPMACSLKECRDMVSAAQQAGTVLMVAQCQRYMPGYRGVKRLVASGEMGNIQAIRFDSMQGGGFPDGHWLYDGQKAGGGVVISVAVHRIDLMRYLVGDVKRVTAVCRNMNPKYINGAEDWAMALLEFDSGAIGEMFATYSGYRMPWGEQFMVFGEDGTIHAVPPLGVYLGDACFASRKNPGKPDDGWLGQYTGFNPVKPVPEGLETDDGFVNEVLHFAECCRTGNEPDSNGGDNIETMKIIFGIYKSARCGESVDI